MTNSERKRDKLINFRTAFTYISNFFVLLASFVIFLVIDDAKLSFKILDIILTVVGLFCSLLYLCLVPEVKLSRQAKEFDHIYKTQSININSSSSSPEHSVDRVAKKPITW